MSFGSPNAQRRTPRALLTLALCLFGACSAPKQAGFFNALQTGGGAGLDGGADGGSAAGTATGGSAGSLGGGGVSVAGAGLGGAPSPALVTGGVTDPGSRGGSSSAGQSSAGQSNAGQSGAGAGQGNTAGTSSGAGPITDLGAGGRDFAMGGTPTAAGGQPAGAGSQGMAGAAGSAEMTAVQLRGSASASSAQNDPSPGGGVHPARDANDGNETTTRWCAASHSVPEWWQLDLGASHALSRVEIVWEYPGQALGHVYGYTVGVSDSATQFPTAPVVDQTNNQSTAKTQIATLPTGTSGRYVRITVTSLPPDTNDMPPFETWASLDEVRVFGQ